MKKYFLKFLAVMAPAVITGIFFISCGRKGGEPFSGPLNNLKRYPYEKFHATYEFSGDARGDEELVVADYGKYELRRTKSDMFSPESVDSEDKGAITLGVEVYSMDFKKHTAVHQRMQYLDSLYHLAANEMPTAQQYFESEMKKNFFINTGSDTIAGKLATRWHQNEGALTLWIWNGILLRKHTQMDSKSFDMTIKTLDTLSAVDTSTFRVPQGFQIIDIPKL